MGNTFCALIIMAAACTADVTGRTGDPDPGDPGSNGSNGSNGSDGDGGSGGSYRWVTGAFGACTVPCGGGTQLRQVLCVDASELPADEALCDGEKPAVQQACNAHSCTSVACTPNPNLTGGFVLPVLAQGSVPFTVRFDVYTVSNFQWNMIDFGDGTTSLGLTMPYAGQYACVVHTYTRTGTFPVGRSLDGGIPSFYPKHDATVVVQ
jgi:thrombospondin type 1 repeat protein